MKKSPVSEPLSSPGARRSFLRLAAGAGAATVGAGLLAACGGGDQAVSSTRESAQTRVVNGCTSKPGAIVDKSGGTIGFIDAVNDSTNVSVIVYSQVNCELREVKLWIGTDLSQVPLSGGAPDYSQFPLKFTGSAGTVQHEFLKSLASMGLSSEGCAKAPPTYYVVGEVTTTCGTGTIIGYAAPNGAGSAITYAAFPLCCTDTPPPPVVLTGCETAFAKGGYVFTTDGRSNPERLPTLGLSRNRWGWAINLRATGTTTYPIYAGAGLNNIAAGTLVGTLTVNYTGSEVTASYAIAPGAAMSEAHLYVGDFKPTTIAPGQFGNNAGFTAPASSHTFSVPVSDSNGDGIWLIAHAVVCGT